MTTKSKDNIAFYIFAKDAEGKTNRVGTAFKHEKGNGMNICIGETRFVAYPPKKEKETQGLFVRNEDGTFQTVFSKQLEEEGSASIVINGKRYTENQESATPATPDEEEGA